MLVERTHDKGHSPARYSDLCHTTGQTLVVDQNDDDQGRAGNAAVTERRNGAKS